jgi:proton-dependent oligopeptide transporter, POT family
VRTVTAAKPDALPTQIPFIIANEGCERFSFYGMRNILTPFLKSSLLLYLASKTAREDMAKEVFHTFVIGVYLFPLLGGWLSDRFFGKYNTVLWFSLIYCAGHGCLALFEDNRNGFYTGLFLIALGSGGIKPLVVSFVGDQFDQRNKHRAKAVFDAFYWIINFGSFFASLLMPIFLRRFGASIAFGIPGVMMAAATLVFWAGRERYVILPPAPPNPDSFLNVVRTALLAPGPGRPGLIVAVIGGVLALGAVALYPWLEIVPAFCLGLFILIAFGGAGASMQLERARGLHSDEAIAGVRAVLGVLITFALVTPFWSLFDQKASTWVIAADAMTKPAWFEPAQMQALNPALVMLLIPFNNFFLYPWLRRLGWEPTPLRKMTAGIAFAGLAWIAIGVIQLSLEAGASLPITWQILPYVLLTFGEVLVSATGLEFAYSQAPLSMKGVIMSFWSLAVTAGNLWVLFANAGVRNQTVKSWVAARGMSQTGFLMFFFAMFAFAAALAFGLYARRYKMKDHYRAA